MRLQKHSFAAMGLAGVLAGFAGISVVQAENADVTYKAELPPLNSKTTGFDARGEATFTISTDLPRAIGSPYAQGPATTRMAMGS